jgi:hypothetical protein
MHGVLVPNMHDFTYRYWSLVNDRFGLVAWLPSPQVRSRGS